MTEIALEVDSTGHMAIEFELNGERRHIRALPTSSLLEVLNQGLGLKGTREGCGVGVCGACTVLVDGTPQSACLLFAFQLEGRSVITIEGLSGDHDSLDRVQRAFADSTAFQCSYCTPGFILTTAALLREHGHVDESTVRDYLSGNLCRCGSYVKILDAVLSLNVKS